MTRRWNQFGIQAIVRAAEEPQGIVVHYRLSISGHRDHAAVHEAFRSDLSHALGGLSVVSAAPASWDLAEMARTVDCGPGTQPPQVAFEADTDYDWEG